MVFLIPRQSKQGSRELLQGHVLVQRPQVQRADEVQWESRTKASHAPVAQPQVSESPRHLSWEKALVGSHLVNLYH